MSVESTGIDRLSQTIAFPVNVGPWTYGFWVKILDYSTGPYIQCLVWTNHADSVIAIDTGETSAPPGTTLDVFMYRSGSEDSQAVATGSYVGWQFVSISYPGSGNNYKVRFRKEGESSLSELTFNLGDVQVPNIFYLFSDSAGDANTRLRSFFFQETEMDDATLLVASSSLSAPAGTNLHFLPLDDASVAEVNLGTGLDWVVNGTLITQAGDDPNPNLGPSGVLIPTYSIFATA